MTTTIHVDVVQPGRALITGPTFSGYVYRQAGQLNVEDVDTEAFIGYARNYRSAGALLAKHHGITNPTVTVDFE